MTAEAISPTEPKSAALLVIGDEVLRGDVVDGNTSWIARRLHSMGIRLQRVVVLPDNKTEIADEITAAVRRFSVVVSCGGVGPTPDDVTYEAAAAAFGIPLVEHPDLVAIVGSSCRMSRVPKGCHLHQIPLAQLGTTLCKPIVQVNKLFMLPGTPANVCAAFPHIEAEVKNTAFGSVDGCAANVNGNHVVFHQRKLCLPVAEAQLVDVLEEAEQRFGKSVTIGSYPTAPSAHSTTSDETVLQLESTSEACVSTALAFLKERLHKHIPEATLMDSLMEFISSADESLANAIREAIQILRECQQKFEPGEVLLCVTGGKEATVLVHLWCAVLGPSSRPISLYVRQDDAFQEVDDFVNQLASRYNLSLDTVPGPLRAAVVSYIEERPQVKAALLGTRRTDPYSSKLRSFHETDSGWPPLTRVSPILDWSYAHVWDFLRGMELPYCSLYDLGSKQCKDVNRWSVPLDGFSKTIDCYATYRIYVQGHQDIVSFTKY